MYWYVKNTLELNGYTHYEISNFAKENKESNSESTQLRTLNFLKKKNN